MDVQKPVMQTGERGWSGEMGGGKWEMNSNQSLDMLSRESEMCRRPATTE